MTITYETTYTEPYGTPDSVPGIAALNAALKEGYYVMGSRLVMRIGGVQVGSTDNEIYLTEGSVSVERFNANRRTLQIDLVGQVGDAISNHLKAYGSLLGMEIQAFSIVNDYAFSLGYFIPDEVDHSQDGVAYTIRAVCGDRSTVIAINRRTSSYTIRNGTPKNQAFEEYIHDRYPGVGLVMEPLEGTTPTLTFGLQDEPWQGAIDLAESFGCETYFDRFGRCVLRSVENPKDQAISAHYSDSDPSRYPFVTEPLKRSINVREIYNGVIVQAEAPWLLFPVCGHKWNTDPTSDTYYDPAQPELSPVGPHPLIIRDSKVGTQAAANALAASKYYEMVGQSEVVTFTAMADPTRDASDVIHVQATEIGVNNRVTVDDFSIPLVAGTMRLAGRNIT